jgi:hypothetical protein
MPTEPVKSKKYYTSPSKVESDRTRNAYSIFSLFQGPRELCTFNKEKNRKEPQKISRYPLILSSFALNDDMHWGAPNILVWCKLKYG